MQPELEVLSRGLLAEGAAYLWKREEWSLIHYHGNTAGPFDSMAMALDGQLQGMLSLVCTLRATVCLEFLSDICFGFRYVGHNVLFYLAASTFTNLGTPSD